MSVEPLLCAVALACLTWPATAQQRNIACSMQSDLCRLAAVEFGRETGSKHRASTFLRCPSTVLAQLLVSRVSASRYLAAVSSITAAGMAGAGACLFHGTPFTLACSSQSRTNCLS